jgi:hypothetical protein
VRIAVRSLREHHQDQLAATAGARVYANVVPDGNCARCGGPMRVQKTTQHNGKTLAHGHFVVRETIYACPTCKVLGPDGKTHRHLSVRRQNELEALLVPGGSVGYDVLSLVGRRRFLDRYQRQEIQDELARQHGIALSTGELSKLERSFTVYLRALHDAKAEPLRLALDGGGGYALHIDATCETGRGTLFVAYCGWSTWVLGAWKIPTERSDAMLPRLRTIEARFGAPRSVMRDLGRAVTEAADALVEARAIPVFACHLHFLKDIGKDLLTPAHDELRGLFRRHKVLTRLAAHARKLGRDIGAHIGRVRGMVEEWLKGERHRALPSGASGLAVVRALAQWILDHGADGEGGRFPFDRPMLDLYERCQKALRAVEALLQNVSRDRAVRRALVSLHTILLPVRSDVPFAAWVRIAQMRASLFDELRGALRLKEKPEPSVGDQSRQLGELRDVEAALTALETSLRMRLPTRGPAQDTRAAIGIILKHLERHGRHLWGHALPLPDGKIRLADRTNAQLEQLFGLQKRGERRRSGRKNLTHDFEQMPADGLLALNLEKQDYLDVVCGGKIENLPAAFAALDAGKRRRSLPIRLGAEPAKDAADVVSSSLPKADRDVVRNSAWTARVQVEARSRAPRRQDARKRGRPTVE